jgi:hypothetical protein
MFIQLLIVTALANLKSPAHEISSMGKSLRKLTLEQQRYLRRYAVPFSAVFDATGLSRSQYQLHMKPLEKLIAVGVTPCAKFGHRMRTRSGTCAQCSPTSLTFLRRHHEEGFVYIATSVKKRLTKVGLSKNPGAREKVINRLGYGGVKDWEIRYQVHLKRAGAVENKLQGELSKYAASFEWTREGVAVTAYETFSCSYRTAKRALDRIK